jgi:hypothetical protein
VTARLALPAYFSSVVRVITASPRLVQLVVPFSTSPLMAKLLPLELELELEELELLDDVLEDEAELLELLDEELAELEEELLEDVEDEGPSLPHAAKLPASNAKQQ